MEKDKKAQGEELLDIDEKGNPIKKEDNKEKNVSSNLFKYIIAIFIFLLIIGICFFFLKQKKSIKMFLMKSH